jgi:molybdopterin molybdotransferase
VLTELKTEFFFTGAQIQPGRPVVFGRVSCSSGEGPGFGGADWIARESGALAPQGHKYYFGLPGNPVSTMVTFELFARPVLEALAGMTPRKLVFLHAKLRSEITARPGLKRFLPAMLFGEFEQAEVELVRWQGSGDIAATAAANCYIVIPQDREHIEPGEWIPILMR